MQFVVIQFQACWQNPPKSLQLLEQKLSELFFDFKTLPAGKDDICVCLPELFASGFSMQPEKFAEPVNGKLSSQLGILAKQYGIFILAGVAQMEHEAFFNRALAFHPSGEQLASYSKQKLFSFATEDKVYRPGNFPTIMTLQPGFNIALFICYDLRFPELFREVAKDVQMMVVLATWPQSRQMHWQVLLQARAIENQSYVLGVNRTGVDANQLEYIGGSVLFNPLGETIFEAKTQALATFELDIAHAIQTINEYRHTFPALKDQ